MNYQERDEAAQRIGQVLAMIQDLTGLEDAAATFDIGLRLFALYEQARSAGMTAAIAAIERARAAAG